MSNVLRRSSSQRKYNKLQRVPRRYVDPNANAAAVHKALQTMSHLTYTPTIGATSLIANNQMNNSTEISYVETDFRDYITNQFIAKCAAERIDVFCEEIHFNIIPNLVEVLQQILANLEYDNTIFASSSNRAQFVVHGIGIVSTRTNSNSSYVEVLGDKKLVQKVLNRLTEEYDEITTSIEWMIGGDGNSVTIPLYAPQGVVDSSYPFIEEGVDQFVDAFTRSSENILLLIGAPGTGKSNFIKHIIARSKSNALITYDPEIMRKDGIFATFIEGEYGSLIMEDADTFLGARTGGNEMMSRMLNVGDGIVSMSNKKLIFSTNLPSTDDIDPALLRPGRCFAVVHFRAMTSTEAMAFCKEHAITTWTPVPGKEYTLAELYNNTKQQRVGTEKRKVGFY